MFMIKCLTGHMFIEITKAEYLEGYKLRIHFNNGEIRIADLEASLEGPIFESLKNIEEFRRFSIPYNTIQWENGADFAPEFLYEISRPE
jgi:hypothetical protein